MASRCNLTLLKVRIYPNYVSINSLIVSFVDTLSEFNGEFIIIAGLLAYPCNRAQIWCGRIYIFIFFVLFYSRM